MHINTGYLAEATALVRHHVEVFENVQSEAVVAPSGHVSARCATSTP
jgi:L-lactate dehydrogenase complex protein LldE